MLPLKDIYNHASADPKFFILFILVMTSSVIYVTQALGPNKEEKYEDGSLANASVAELDMIITDNLESVINASNSTINATKMVNQTVAPIGNSTLANKYYYFCFRWYQEYSLLAVLTIIIIVINMIGVAVYFICEAIDKICYKREPHPYSAFSSSLPASHLV